MNQTAVNVDSGWNRSPNWLVVMLLLMLSTVQIMEVNEQVNRFVSEVTMYVTNFRFCAFLSSTAHCSRFCRSSIRTVIK